jgi:hypothetical protein
MALDCVGQFVIARNTGNDPLAVRYSRVHTADGRDRKGQSDPTPAINSVALAGAYEVGTPNPVLPRLAGPRYCATEPAS